MIILKKPEITIVLVYQVYLYIKKKTLWGDYSDYYCESLPYNHGNLW